MPPSTTWIAHLLAAVAAVVAGASGAVEAIVTAIDRGADVTATAERGEHFEDGVPTRPTTTPYGLPVADGATASWGDTHAGYPATDVFSGCGATLVSPVFGTVLDLRRTDPWDPAIDDPATRGGKYVSLLGFDGVRYYMAHFDTIEPDLRVGDEVELGRVLGTMGDTGRSSACHLHFGISPPCQEDEWAVRRGVVWPHEYLDAWRAGEQRSPAADVERWVAQHPDGCAEAAAA